MHTGECGYKGQWFLLAEGLHVQPGSGWGLRGQWGLWGWRAAHSRRGQYERINYGR